MSGRREGARLDSTRAVKLISDTRDYFARRNQVISRRENTAYLMT